MSTIRFGEDAKVAVLILWELCKEGLEQFPDVRSSGNSGGHRIGAVRESCPNWLIDIEHIRVLIKAVWIQRRR
jgi:hypothetical protein